MNNTILIIIIIKVNFNLFFSTIYYIFYHFQFFSWDDLILFIKLSGLITFFVITSEIFFAWESSASYSLEWIIFYPVKFLIKASFFISRLIFANCLRLFFVDTLRRCASSSKCFLPLSSPSSCYKCSLFI